MSGHLSSAEKLRNASALLYAFTKQANLAVELRSADLDALIHDAQAREHRRAAFKARDASC